MVVITIFIFTGIIQADNFMKLNEIKSGMTGIGKTVFKGTKVENFPIKVVEVINNNLNNNLILIKATGNKIERIGGIAAGMSGSPIYINGKLAGALAYAWKNTNYHYAMVTPINRMLKLFNKDKAEKKAVNEMKLKSPLVVSGIRGRALKQLKKDLSPYGMQVLTGSGAENFKKNGSDTTLKPGSAVAVQLVRGDISIASIGTLTYINNGDILAFGHPFTNKGDVNFLLSKAYINTIIPSRTQPFKLGTPFDKLLGIINQDRGAGIAGNINQYPQVIPLTINVKDITRGIEQQVIVQLIDNEPFLTYLGNNIVLQAIDNTIDRIGEGTARVNIKMMGKGIPDLKLERENIFYSRNDIALQALSDFSRLLNIISSNSFREIDIKDLKLDINVTRQHKTALLQKTKVLNQDIYPGDTLKLELTLHPFRKPTLKKIIKIKLPETINDGITNVLISGGQISSYSQLPQNHGQNQENNNYEIKQDQITGYKSFDSMLDDFLDAPHNNDLIVKVFPGYSKPPLPNKKSNKKTTNNKTTDNNKKTDDNTDKNKKENEMEPNNKLKSSASKNKKEIKKIVETDYVLSGTLNLQIKVKKKSNSTSNKK